MKNILEYLEHSAKLFPTKTALAIKDESICFYDLMIQSKKLATIIKKMNKSKTGIAVFVNRGMKTVVLFMAAVYSGSYYIPIDPDMPKEKIKTIIDESNSTVVLGEDCNHELFNSLDVNAVFLTDKDSTNDICDMPSIESHSPLYMVYTSGSTGKPKGVVKSHGAFIDFIETYTATFNFTSDEIIGNQTPLFFDASAKDIYLMLKTGATLEIIPTEKFAMPTELIDYLNERKITFICWVPTALSIVAQIRTFSFIVPQYLKRVFFVGEVMPMKALNYWRKYLPDVQFVNLYGQSEISGISCYYEVIGEYANDENLPIGKPLSNCEIYLLNDSNIIKEADQIGEIYVVGDSLATMYYNDEEKTKTSFLSIDFGQGTVRAFKTGDLAYYNENGLLNFASRSDYQIKHLGHRIELGEIESIAGALNEIQRCCCLYNSKKQQIVLFCELSQNIETIPLEIKRSLKKNLSSYMVPEKVVILDSLPINANGKIDRQTLKEKL